MPRRWEQTRRANPVDEALVATYRRLTMAEEAITASRRARGVSWDTIEDALAGSELSDEEIAAEHDVYLTTLTRFVAALGGRVEVRAVFSDGEPLTVWREPDMG